MKKNKNKDKGFTLIELLVTISVLALIMTIVIYVAISVVDNVNEKTYSITVNNIQKITSEYLLENSDRLFYINKDVSVDNLEFQCVTVNDLVENGYFKEDVYESKVSKNRYVKEDDYVYIERDKDTKAVSKIKYLLDDEYVSMCDKAVKAISDVSIIVSPEDWSTYKDITIDYRVKNYFNINNYTYHYSYSKDDVVSVISDNGNEKKLRVTDNGIIKAWVEDKNGNVLDFGNEMEINKIDNEAPIIDIQTNGGSYVKTIDSRITITDSGVGGDSSTYKYIYSINNSVEPDILFTSGKNYKLSGETGIYYLIVKACDKFGNCSKKVSDKLYIDNTQPIITLGTNGNSSYVKSVSSKITVSDLDSGGDSSTYKYIYSTSSSATSNTIFTSANSYSLKEKTGIYYLIINACDKAGNCNKKVSNKFYLDNTGPTININNDLTKIYGTKFDLYEGVSITDSNSGLSSKKVYLNNKEITNSSSLSIGKNNIVYKSKDKVGNESSKSRVVTLVVADAEFNYLEKDQIYSVQADGTYIIEAYGAQGGNSGGKGGYVKAEVNLKIGDTLIINTGGVNGYNGGGGYKNSKYYSGGGATTVRYNNKYIVIAGGGGAKGTEGTAGLGGSGNGNGGADVGVGAGLKGSNGGGGSNSLNYNYDCNCQTCGGGCKSTARSCDTCHGRDCSHCIYDDKSSQGWICGCTTTSYSCNCYDYCTSRHPTYSCNCQTCTKKGKSGNGGANSIKLPAVFIENLSGKRSSNGYVKVSYKLED